MGPFLSMAPAAGAVMTPEVRQALEDRVVDSVRALLISMSNGQAGTGRAALVRLGTGVEVTRGDMEDWLREKERSSTRWIKTAAIAAIVAAVIALLAWLFPIGGGAR